MTNVRAVLFDRSYSPPSPSPTFWPRPLTFPRSSHQRSCEGIRIPETITFSNSKLDAWYAYDPETRQVVKRPSDEVTPEAIFYALTRRGPQRRRIQSGIVAIVITTEGVICARLGLGLGFVNAL